MRCDRCRCVIERDEETWIQGKPICADCAKQNVMRWWKGIGVVLAIVLGVFVLLFLLPFLFFCVCGGIMAGGAAAR